MDATLAVKGLFHTTPGACTYLVQPPGMITLSKLFCFICFEMDG